MKNPSHTPQSEDNDQPYRVRDSPAVDSWCQSYVHGEGDQYYETVKDLKCRQKRGSLIMNLLWVSTNLKH